MSQKDFTDYNGKKRKLQFYPPKDKPVRKMGLPRREKPCGFKIKVDRLRSAIQELVDLKARRAVDFGDHRSRCWRRNTLKHCRSYINKIRKMKKEMVAEGIYNQALASIREQGWPKAKGIWAELLRRRGRVV